MTGYNQEFGKYGATGEQGGELLGRRLDSLSGGISTPVTEKRGFLARVRYLTSSDNKRADARNAGFKSKSSTINGWMSGETTPTKKSREAVEHAYNEVRRKNVAGSLKRRLNNNGQGTRVEIHPAGQSQVPQEHRRSVPYRHVNVRDWNGAVDAWVNHDHEALHDEYVTMIEDLGSDWGKYENATSVGFSA